MALTRSRLITPSTVLVFTIVGVGRNMVRTCRESSPRSSSHRAMVKGGTDTPKATMSTSGDKRATKIPAGYTPPNQQSGPHGIRTRLTNVEFSPASWPVSRITQEIS